MKNQYPSDLTLEDIKIAIRQAKHNPSIGKTFQHVLKDGPRTFKIATIFEIMNAKTRELHHYSLRLDCFRKLKSEWQHEDKRSLILDGNAGEIDALVTFIRGISEADSPPDDGIFHIVDDDFYETAQHVAGWFKQADSPAKSELIRAVIEDISSGESVPVDFLDAFESGSIKVLSSIATSARIVQYRRVLSEFRSLIEESVSGESQYQKMLEDNPWLFGSEYSELLDRRNWTRDDRLDFMLRRTVDDYLEIIEIKTPFTNALFNRDTSHDSHYPSAKLSEVIGQVMRYIKEIERDRDRIRAQDGYDVLKIRARIIIGGMSNCV